MSSPYALSPLELGLLALGLAVALGARRMPPRLAASVPVLLTALGVLSITLRFERLAPANVKELDVAASLGAFLALPCALVPARARWAVASVTLLLAALLALSDVVYLWTYGDVIPWSAFRFAGQAGSLVGPAVRSLPRYAYFTVLPAGIALAAWARLDRPPPRVRLAQRLVEVACVLGLAVPGARAVSAYLRGAAKDSALALRPVAEKGFLFAHARDAARALRPETGDRSTDVALVREVRRERARPSPPPSFGAARGKNLLFVQVESLNAFLLDAKVDGELVMPTLASLCARSLCWDHVLDQTDTGRSSDADHLVMTSLLPLPREAVSVVLPEPRLVALPRLLADRGYATFSSVADHPTFWNYGRRHRAYGVSTSVFRPSMKEGPELGLGMADGAFFADVEPRIAKLPRPFFAWLITLSLHAPYKEPPPELVPFRAGALHGTPLGSHLEIARYTDAAIRDLLDALDRDGALADTVVVIYGDHGEGYQLERDRLSEVGAGWGDMPSRVPLVIHVPGSGLVERRHTPVGLVDVAPTVLALVGAEAPRAFLGAAFGEGQAARVDGQVFSDELAWLGDRCVARASGEELDEARCQVMRTRGARQVDASIATIHHELGDDL